MIRRFVRWLLGPAPAPGEIFPMLRDRQADAPPDANPSPSAFSAVREREDQKLGEIDAILRRTHEALDFAIERRHGGDRRRGHA